MSERAATHVDPKEDAILAAWQQTTPAFRGNWLSFRAGFRSREAEVERLRRVLAAIKFAAGSFARAPNGAAQLIEIRDTARAALDALSSGTKEEE